MLEKDQALCLKCVDYSETSQVITLFTREHGVVSLMVRGSRRSKSAFGGAIELFSYGDVVYSPARTSNLGTLTEFDRSPKFIGLRKSMYMLNCSMLSAELTLSLIRRYSYDSTLFDSLVNFLVDLQQVKNKEQMLALLLVFEITLLGELGLGLVLDHCANCNISFSERWQEFYFSEAANGLLCRDCERNFYDKLRLDPVSAKILSDLRLMHDASEQILFRIHQIFLMHFTYLLNQPPKMAKYFTS